MAYESRSATENNPLEKILDLIQKVNVHSKLTTEVTDIITGMVSKNPEALDNTYTEYFLKAHFGESNYDVMKKIYVDIINK